RHDERAAERSRLREVRHVSAMQDVEDAVGEDERALERAGAFAQPPRLADLVLEGCHLPCALNGACVRSNARLDALTPNSLIQFLRRGDDAVAALLLRGVERAVGGLQREAPVLRVRR